MHPCDRRGRCSGGPESFQTLPGATLAGPAVELIIVVHDVSVRAYPPTYDFVYGEWLRDRYECGEVPEPITGLAAC